MSLNEALIPMALGAPLLASVGICTFGRRPDVRETLNLLAAVALMALCGVIAVRVGGEVGLGVVFLRPLPGVALAFNAEPFGALFALAASGFWVTYSLFAIGVLRATAAPAQTPVHACAALIVAAAAGIAFAANLFTLFVFTQLMSLASYGLLVCRGEKAARGVGALFLAVQLGASIGLFVPGMIGVVHIAGSTDFVAGGLLAHRLAPGPAGLLLTLLTLGTATAAVVPAPSWMTAMLAAPGPGGALQASLVLGAGAFTLIKLNIYTFGAELLSKAPATVWLLRLAAVSMMFAAFKALSTTDLRGRLAWLAVMQAAGLSACALLGDEGAAAAMTGLINLMAATLALFMGAVVIAMGVDPAVDAKALSRAAPFTGAAFAAAAWSFIGFAPFGGMWSRWLLLAAARTVGQSLMFWAMILASLTAVIALAPTVLRWKASTEAVRSSLTLPALWGPVQFAVGALVAAATLCVLLVGLDGYLWTFIGAAMGVRG